MSIKLVTLDIGCRIVSIILIMMIIIIFGMTLVILMIMLKLLSILVKVIMLLIGLVVRFLIALLLMVLQMVNLIFERGFLMSHGYRLWVSLVVCVCCISSMLFLDTLKVNASGITSASDMLGTSIISDSSVTYNVDFTVEPTSTDLDISGGTFNGNTSSNGVIPSGSNHNNSGTILSGRVYGNGPTYSSSSESGTYSENYSGTGGTYRGTVSSGTTGYITMDMTGTIALAGLEVQNSGSTSGTISLNTSSDGSCLMHCHLPLPTFFNLSSGVSIDPSAFYGVVHSIDSVSVSSGDLENIIVSDSSGFIYDIGSSNHNVNFISGSQLLTYEGSKVGSITFIDFDFVLANLNQQQNVSLSVDVSPVIKTVKDSYKNYIGNNIVTDPRSNALQEENNEITEDTNSTTHSIFDSISDFFGSFFNNLIGVFVPEDGYFSSWFNRLNTMLSDKLGVLYFPFEFIIETLNQINSSASVGTQANCNITFPEIAFNNSATGERYVFLEKQVVNLRSFNVNVSESDNSSLVGTPPYTNLLFIIRRFNNIAFSMALISLFIRKLNLIIRGSENDN